MISIIIPTLNERESLEHLLPELHEATAQLGQCEVIIVDDGSTDGTVTFLRAHITHFHFAIKIIERQERGLATAVLRGFEEATGDLCVVMDADLSHPPAVILKLIAALIQGADLAVASRRVHGGGVEEWPVIRRMYSYFATWCAKPLARGVADPLSGFFALHKKMIEGKTFSPLGYKILLELLVKVNCGRIVEIPYIFRNRDVGKSKLNSRVALAYYAHLFWLYVYQLRRTIFLLLK